MADDKKIPNNWTVPAKNFVGTIMANVDNDLLSDAEFRDFIRNTLSIVEKDDFDKIANDSIKERIKQYYA